MSSHDDVTGATPSGGATNGSERFKPPAGWSRSGRPSGSFDGDSAADAAQASQAAVTARYTTVPATPPGYSFQRSADAPETGSESGTGYRAASGSPYSAYPASGSSYSAPASSGTGYGPGSSAGAVPGPVPSTSSSAGGGGT